MTKTYDQYCPVAVGLDHLGDRWTFLILRDLAWYGPARFTDLIDSNPGMPPALLTDRLNTLVQNGVIEQTANKTYRLTRSGSSIREVIDALARFGTDLLTRESLNDKRLRYLASRLSVVHMASLGDIDPSNINFIVEGHHFSFEFGPDGVDLAEPVESAPTINTDLTGLAGLVNGELGVNEVDISGPRSPVEDLLGLLQPVKP